MLDLSAIYASDSRSPPAALGGVGLQTVRNWVVAFNAHGPDGLTDGNAPSERSRSDAERREALRVLIEQDPMPAANGAVRWELVDLAQILFEDHGVSSSTKSARAVRDTRQPTIRRT